MASPTSPSEVYDEIADRTAITDDTSGAVLQAAIKSNAHLRATLKAQENGFVSVNTRDTMRDLVQVSDLLTVAYAGAHGLPSSSVIIGMQSDYQDLVKSSLVTSGAFFRAALRAVKFHDDAIEMLAEALKPENADSKTVLIETAVEMLAACSEVAADMVKACDKLIEACDKLLKQARDSLVAANNDSVSTEKERKELEQEMAKQEALRAQLQKMKNEYNEAIKKYDEEQKRLDDKAEMAMWVDLGATVISGVIKATGSIAQAAVSVYAAPYAAPTKAINAVGEAAARGAAGGGGGAGGGAGASAAGTAAAKAADDPKSVLARAEAKANNRAETEAAAKEEKELTTALEETKKEAANLEADASKADKLSIAKKKIEVLEKQLKDNKERQTALKEAGKHLKQASDEVAAAMDKVSEKAGKFHEQLSARAAEAGEKAFELRKLQAEVSGNLEGTVVKLASMNKHSSQLERTLASLETVILVLGQIKTAFSNTKAFWEGVRAHAESLSKGKDDAAKFVKLIAVASMRTRLMDTIKATAVSWMCFANVSYTAYQAMKEAGAKVDEAMSNIPGNDEAQALVDKLAPQILRDIKSRRSVQNFDEDEKPARRVMATMAVATAPAPATVAAPAPATVAATATATAAATGTC